MQLFMILFLLPCLVTQIIICTRLSAYDGQWRKRIVLIGTPVNIVFNSISLLVTFSLVYHVRAPMEKIADLLFLRCSYQDVGRLCFVLIISTAVAFLLGLGGYFWLNRELPSFSRAQKGGFLLLAILIMIPSIAVLSLSHSGSKNLMISGVCRKASVSTLGGSGGPVSYIEIINNGPLAFEADGIYFSDDEFGENRRPLGNVLLPAGTRYTFEMPSNKSFNIKKGGGTVVFLFDKFSNLIDSITVPALSADETFQLVDHEWEVVNIAPEVEEPPSVKAPVFSAQGGFYPNAFHLVLTADSGTTIYYTLDGSIPGVESKRYTGAIYVYDRSAEPNRYRSIQNVTSTYLENWKEPEVVDKAFIVRAIAVDEAGNSSGVVTMTYFVDLDQYKDKTVVSLVADPDDLFGDNGIYVTGPAFDAWYAENLEAILQEEKEKEEKLKKLEEDGASEEEIAAVKNEATLRDKAPGTNYSQRGEASERPANIELFDSGSGFSETLNQAVGIRIQGASTRGRMDKRFSIYARKSYSGSNVFDAELFEGKRTHSVFLREGFDNAFSNALVVNRDISVQQSFPVCVFLNGEYWYSTYLMEKYNDIYFAETYGISKDNVQFLKFSWAEMAQEEKETYNRTINNYITHNDFTEDAAYQGFCQMVDIQSFIDFMCANIYLGNCDMQVQNNYGLYRAYIEENEDYGDGRWRWCLYDMDLVWYDGMRQYQVDTAVQLNNYTMSGHSADPYTEPFLLQPAGKDYLWGGSRLNDDFAKGIGMSPLAETWECSTHKDGPSAVASGSYRGKLLSDVLREHPEMLGTHPKTENGELPILIKLIDAKKDLSVQVHPDDAYAHAHENGSLGKTEMWYVLEAAKDAKLIYGFRRDMERDEVCLSISDGTIEQYLRKVPIHKGDVFYIPSGCVHAVGAGALIAEVQQSSNVTYRLYDYDRVDKHGERRELHIEKALDVADLRSSEVPRQPMRVFRFKNGSSAELLCRCKYFQVEHVMLNTERHRKMARFQTGKNSFQALLCTDGCGVLYWGEGQMLNFYRGDCIFVPACSPEIRVHGQAHLLKVSC